MTFLPYLKHDESRRFLGMPMGHANAKRRSRHIWKLTRSEGTLVTPLGEVVNADALNGVIVVPGTH